MKLLPAPPPSHPSPIAERPIVDGRRYEKLASLCDCDETTSLLNEIGIGSPINLLRPRRVMSSDAIAIECNECSRRHTLTFAYKRAASIEGGGGEGGGEGGGGEREGRGREWKQSSIAVDVPSA